jgi:hypothetical protein
MTNLIAKELHSILNNDKGNLNNNLNPCRFLFQGDLVELAYKCFGPSRGRSTPALDGKIVNVSRRKINNFAQNASDFNKV